jgi:hypothetical protein
LSTRNQNVPTPTKFTSKNIRHRQNGSTSTVNSTRSSGKSIHLEADPTDNSGMDTDATEDDDAVIVIEPANASQSTVTIRPSDLEMEDECDSCLPSSTSRSGAPAIDGMEVDRALGRLMTQMSIIDLTGDD